MSALLSVTLEDVQRPPRASPARGPHALPRGARRCRGSPAEVWVKFENLQFTGSFKERGALNKLLQLSPTSASAA